MAKNSKIEWTDHTFNPWIGCTKVSDGCKNCYAETWANRYPDKWAGTWGPTGTRIKTSDANWRKPIIWDKQAAAAGVREKVFCGSLCDVFEDKSQTQAYDLYTWRQELWELIEQTPNLDWLLLTKRPWIPNVTIPARWHYDWPDNVWMGTSIENQEQADIRIPLLLHTPARIHWLSCEPLLGPIEFPSLDGIDWVIVGGESGPDRRPMDLAWARDIRDQCQMVGVPFFFKQVDKVQEIPANLMIREFPVVAA